MENINTLSDIKIRTQKSIDVFQLHLIRSLTKQKQAMMELQDKINNRMEKKINKSIIRESLK